MRWPEPGGRSWEQEHKARAENNYTQSKLALHISAVQMGNTVLNLKVNNNKRVWRTLLLVGVGGKATHPFHARQT